MYVKRYVLWSLKEPKIQSCLTQLTYLSISVEIAFRNFKHHFGFGDYRMTSTTGFFRFVHLYCISFCLWRLMAIPENTSRWFMETSMKVVNESALIFARARRALMCFDLSKILFREFAPETDFEKSEV